VSARRTGTGYRAEGGRGVEWDGVREWAEFAYDTRVLAASPASSTNLSAEVRASAMMYSGVWLGAYRKDSEPSSNQLIAFEHARHAVEF